MACHGGQVGWFSQCQIQAKVAVTARPWWPGCVVASPPLSLGIRIAGPTSCYRTFQLPLDLQASTGKLMLLSRCKTPSLRAQVSLRPGDHGSRPQPKLNFEFYIFDPVNDGWGGSHWSEVELGLELGPEKGQCLRSSLFALQFIVYFS